MSFGLFLRCSVRLRQQIQCRLLYSMVCITVPENELATRLAHEMVTKNMIACANIIPKVTSVYLWKGTVCEDKEVFMFLKTRTTRVKEVVEFVQQNHPYEVCEVISLPITGGSSKYLNWVGEVVPPK
ncbi:hypothetical protein R5R35_013656 [Gryllus longicercus]